MSAYTKTKTWLFLLLLLANQVHICVSGWRPRGEFVAGSFILTQKSLNEAPYRYAGVLRKALDRVEAKEPPSQSDEEKCDVRYRIEPSGRRSLLRIIDNTLSFTLQENNTLIIAAKVYAAVAAKTWIWKGINFGLLGCLKMNSCNGQIVTYSAHIDFQISIQVFWNKQEDRMSINIKPVDTKLNNVNVAGCKPPWYLWWFKKWQKLLNEGVQEAFQSYANNYEHQKEIPEEFSLFKNVYVHYLITDLIWSKDFVVFEAKAIFLATLGGQNVTFVPSQALEAQADIPVDKWNMTSPDDGNSHLLQGVRLSTEFVNCIMWFASVTNMTQYHGSARVLDTRINGTISYDAPVIRVQEDNLLNVNIGKGLILAECLPVDTSQREPAVLFKAQFSQLAGSGRIRLASTADKTGIRVSLDKLDLSKMNTKPFEPKLPLPETFESELMKTAIGQLQPVINQYMTENPLYLPENIAPLAASPMVNLWRTGNGTGYAEVLSYCTCDVDTGTPFALCDDRSRICDQGQSKKKPMTSKPVSKALDETGPEPDSELLFNFTMYYENSKENLSYIGFHFTLFQDSSVCRLDHVGSTAQVYWLWETARCTPIFVRGHKTQEYYLLDGPKLLFACEDKLCRNCQYDLAINRFDNGCKYVEAYNQSFHVGRPLVYSWQTTTVEETVVANVFYSDFACIFHFRYLEPQLWSTHVSLGYGNQTDKCLKNEKDTYVRHERTGDMITRADWDCADNCFACFFRLNNVGIDNCHEYKENIRIVFTKSIQEITKEPLDTINSQDIYLAVGSALVVASLVAIVGLALVYKKYYKNFKKPKMSCANLSVRMCDLKSGLVNVVSKHVGFRVLTWSKQDAKAIKEDVIQNLLLISNGILAIVFAYEWNSENNPLLIIHHKFKSGFTVSVDIFDIDAMAEFASSLNFWTLVVNVANASVAFLIVLTWLCTKTGERGMWMKVRLTSCASLLASIFVVIAAVIFSTYFDDLVVLEQDKGYFITDNESMHSFMAHILKVSLNGLSLTVISFTIVFLFHGVGGGLYCGTVLFRLFHLHSKTSNMEALTTLLVILTIIQPFICLHPVIIWSQDSQHNSSFLLLIILIWFLPVCVHILVKAILSHGVQRCQDHINSSFDDQLESAANQVPEPPTKRKIEAKVDTGLKKRKTTAAEVKCSTRKKAFLKFFDIVVQTMQLAFFLSTFTVVTHHIVNTEFTSDRRNLQNFVLPAIVSVFVWMVSTSYLLLSLVLDESRKSIRLVFKDQNLTAARTRLRTSLRRRLHDMDRRSLKARSLQRQTMFEAAEIIKKRNNKHATLPTNPSELDLSESLRGGQIGADKTTVVQVQKPRNKYSQDLCASSKSILSPGNEDIPLNNLDDDEKLSSNEATVNYVDENITWLGRLKKLVDFLLETVEYKDPQTHGWRIKFRRLFLTVGVIAFTYQTIHTAVSTQNYSSKEEIQTILDYTGTNLTWPDSGSVLDDVFKLYNSMERTKSYLMMASTLLFWTSMVLDFVSHNAKRLDVKSLLLSASRVINFFGSLTVFASVIVVGLPDYLQASNLDTICPFCGYDFNRTVRQVAEFSIGLFFACLFTFQLIPILVTIAPALVRAAVLILIHPSLQVDDSDEANLRMTILQQVIQFSSLLTFPITFISMAILQQYQKDLYVTLLIVAFWVFPPFMLYLGLHLTRKYRRSAILLAVYYLYNCMYVGLLFSLVFYSMTLQRILEVLEKLLQESTFWASSIAQVFLCNVVISDMLYMTVF